MAEKETKKVATTKTATKTTTTKTTASKAATTKTTTSTTAKKPAATKATAVKAETKTVATPAKEKVAAKAPAKKEEPKLEFIEKNLSQNKITEPVVIPSAVNASNVRKVEEPTIPMPQEESQGIDDILGDITAPVDTPQPVEAPMIAGFDDEEPAPVIPQAEIEETPEVLTAQPKKRGRPKKEVKVKND